MARYVRASVMFFSNTRIEVIKMKTMVLLCAFLFTATAFGQVGRIGEKPKQSAMLTSDETQLLVDLTMLKGAAGACGSDFLQDDEACRYLNVKLARLYEEIGRSPRLVRELTAAAVSEYQRRSNSPGSKSPLQVAEIVGRQNAELIPLLIIQNQRMIELLEIIAKRSR